MANPLYLGVDTGGTFTDMVGIGGDGRLYLEKTLSTPDHPDQAVTEVIAATAQAGGETADTFLARTERFAHGTTVSTNALIQRKGAVVGLLTTRGFEDTLHIARGPIGRAGGIPQSWAMDFIHTDPPAPLVPKHLIRGLSERMTSDGTILVPLDDDEVRAAIEALIGAGIESLAVCLLWSFRNPVHEIRIGDIVREMAPGLNLNLSSEIAPRMGEFERTATTVVNGYIGPLSERYIGALQDRLGNDGLRHPVQVMKASGGLVLSGQIGRQAVSVINSGPIGGLVAARYLAGELGFSNVITADMGGTSFDVGLIADGRFEEQSVPFIDHGLPVLVPSLKIVTIGAGGGSIARSDGYRLHVGPQSAGSAPGPACYANGGTDPTVTDALVTLGIINPENFFGGKYQLDPSLALQAIEDRVAQPLEMDVMAAAAGIYQVVNAKMADLMRKVTIESGNDPRDFCLFAYGGGAGAHCVPLAAQLGIGKVIMPYSGPVFSALGIAISDITYGYGRSDPVSLDGGTETLNRVNDGFAELERRALDDMTVSGIDSGRIILKHRIDMRYQGQMNEVTLDWPDGRMDEAGIAQLKNQFEEYYQRRFGAGTIRRETLLELIAFRVEAVKPTEKPPMVPLFDSDEPIPKTTTARQTRLVHIDRDGVVEAVVHDFNDLRSGMVVAGAAIIERDSTTVWLPQGSKAQLDIFGNLEIDPGTGAGRLS